MTRRIVVPLIVVTGIFLDQATKLLIDRAMHLHQSIPVIDGLFSITYVRNRGAAFSILAGSPWRLPFFVAVTLVALVVIGFMIRRAGDGRRLEITGLSMVMSGAVGNLIDRVRMGEVIDFLDVYWRTHHWPAFNVADSLICIGVGILMLDAFMQNRRRRGGR